MGTSNVYTRCLHKAAEILGGTRQLGAYLRVASTDLKPWLDGDATPPTAIFLEAVDLITSRATVNPIPYPLPRADRPSAD